MTSLYLTMIMISSLLLFFRRFIFRKKNIPDELFSEALRKENDGNFAIAKGIYERALDEINKTGFQGSDLKNKIIDKLKVLDTVINYGNSFHYDRKHVV